MGEEYLASVCKQRLETGNDYLHGREVDAKKKSIRKRVLFKERERSIKG